MIGASIYGFVDYQKTSHRREFNNMYTDPVVSKTDVPDLKQQAVVPVTDETKTVAENNQSVVNTTTVEKKPVAKVKKIKRRFNISEFSRAPIREEVIVPDKPEKETKKTEIKEQ